MLFKLVVSQLAVLSTAIPTGTSLKAASAMLEQGTNKTVSALGHSILDECILYDGKEFTHGAELLRSVSLDQKRNYVISILYRGGISQDIPWLQGKSNVWLRDTCKNELIKSPPPPPPYYDSCHDIHTQEGCTGGMCFWADGGCHSDVPPGVTCDKGPAGDEGEQGPQGEKGKASKAASAAEDMHKILQMLKTRVNMLMGQPGPKGDRGPEGYRGEKGPDGLAGDFLSSGYSMRDCLDYEIAPFYHDCKYLLEPDYLQYFLGYAQYQPFIECKISAARKYGCCPVQMGSRLGGGCYDCYPNCEFKSIEDQQKNPN